MNKLTEKDIRPQQFAAGQKIAALTDVGRMLTRCVEFVTVACPACSSTATTPRFAKNGIQYLTCVNCQTFYVSPRPTPHVLDWFYSSSPNYAYWNEHIFPASEAARRERIFKPRVDRLLEICKKYGVATNALLEVGAGFGTFCSELLSRKVFTRVMGVEPTPDLAKSCRDRGIEILETPIEKMTLKDAVRFDVVASFEVIEHLFDPAKFIIHMLRLLKPGGLIMLTCPNGQGFDIETLGIVSDSVDHEHLNYFNPSSLATLMSASGLDVLESFTPGKLDAELVRNKVLSGDFELSKQPFLQKVLIDEWDQRGEAFQDFLVATRASSSLWIVARKPV